MAICLICGKDLIDGPHGVGALDMSHRVKCSKCGEYSYTNQAGTLLSDQKIDSYKYKISSWVSEQNKVYNENPQLSEETIQHIMEMPDKKIREKFECLLKDLINYKTNTVVGIDDFNHCYTKDIYEFNSIIKKAIKYDYINTFEKGNFVMNGFLFAGFTVDGLEYLEDIDVQNKESSIVFVAFHFTDEMKNIYDNYISTAIHKTDFIAKRVSSSSTATETTISDEIISLINSSRIVVADFSGQRNAVYFEAGYAMGKRIPVIWCCKKDEVEKLSFDTRQYPHILWEDGEDLQKQLVNRINAMK